MRAPVGATLLLPVALLSLVACAPSGPAIQEVAPAKGEANVAGDAPIRVSFNQDMDRASVESRFRVRPAIEGCDRVTCPISWSGRVMILRHPQHQFATDTRYLVTIGAGYRDTRGQSVGLEHYWDFKTESAPSIGSVSPSDQATGVAVDADITVQLTRSVTVPSPPELTLTAADDPEPVSYRLGIAPDDSRRLVLSPLALLRPKVSYTLHLGTGVQDIHHNPLSAARDFQFTTGALDLTRSLGFLVRDEGAATSSRVALLRPPAAVNAPAPSLRVLYNANRPIQSFGFTPNSSALYVLDGTGGLTVAPLDGMPATDTGISATAIAANPVRDEVAYVTGGGALHIWRRNLAATADLPQAQAGKVSGVPAWSG
ncbi:MAG TPA: Ig-like domain-containing protein, partial [Candidatus Dormibacteraeota bacterium]